MPLGFPLPDLMTVVALSFAICTTVCALAMEAAVIFTPAFLFVFPLIVTGWPALHPAEAIGLSLGVEVFGYTSSVTGYWYREQVDFDIALKILAITIPIAVVSRAVSFVVPSNVLLLAFGFMLAGLAGVLFQAHRHGSASLIDYLPASLADHLHSATVTKEYLPRTRFFGDEGEGFTFNRSDGFFVAVGGVMAGLVGIAIGEIAQTTLSVRKRVPLKISTGTSALVLHVTIIAALLMTLALMRFAPGLAGHGFSIPLRALAVIAPVVVVGGQVGSYINSRLSEQTTLRVLMTAYFLVGVFVIVRVLFL